MLKPFWNKTFKSMTRWKIHGSEGCTDPGMMLLTTGLSQVSLWMLCGCEAVLDRCAHHTHFALRIQNRSVANIRKDLRAKAAKRSLLWPRKPRHTPLHGVLSFGTIHVHTVEHICFVNFRVQTNQSWCQQVCMLIGSKKKNGDTRYVSIPGSNQFKRNVRACLSVGWSGNPGCSCRGRPCGSTVSRGEKWVAWYEGKGPPLWCHPLWCHAQGQTPVFRKPSPWIRQHAKPLLLQGENAASASQPVLCLSCIPG